MNLKRTITPAALVLALAVSGVPALAQQGEKGGQRRQDNRSARSNAGRERGDNRSARSPGDRDRESRGNDEGRRFAVPRGAPREDAARRDDSRSDNRGYDGRRDVGRSDNRGYDGRRDVGRSDNRGYDGRRDDYRGYDARRYDPRRNDVGRYSNRAYGPGYYARPYRPRTGVRFGLGISIFAGRPFAFSFGYGRTPGYAYRYPMRSGIAYGGVSFLVDPDFAEVYIDGVFVGYAREFGGQPVPVSAGYHRVELYAPDCEAVAFDVSVMPGQVIPYRGSLVPVY